MWVCGIKNIHDGDINKTTLNKLIVVCNGEVNNTSDTSATTPSDAFIVHYSGNVNKSNGSIMIHNNIPYFKAFDWIMKHILNLHVKIIK